MTTEDVSLSYTAGWTAIVMTGTVVHITELRGTEILYRFGISSSSKGTLLDAGKSLSVDETIYVKPINKHGRDVVITVTKD